jgi:DNA-binding PucR family transcriptional regulator
VRCVDHVPTLVIFHAEGLLDTAAARRLRPFGRLSAPSRHRLSQTLLTLLRCHFNATKAAAQLHVHPQTVRLRLQRLEEIFGDELQNRDHRLEMQMLLYAGLARGMRR